MLLCFLFLLFYLIGPFRSPSTEYLVHPFLYCNLKPVEVESWLLNSGNTFWIPGTLLNVGNTERTLYLSSQCLMMLIKNGANDNHEYHSSSVYTVLCNCLGDFCMPAEGSPGLGGAYTIVSGYRWDCAIYCPPKFLVPHWWGTFLSLAPSVYPFSSR